MSLRGFGRRSPARELIDPGWRSEYSQVKSGKLVRVGVDVQLIDPLREPDRWDGWLKQWQTSCVFQCSGWLHALHDSYGYRPMGWVVLDAEEPAAMLAVAEVNSLLTGLRGVALPFSDYSPLLARDPASAQRLVGALCDYGQQRRWRHVSWRGSESEVPVGVPSDRYLMHTIALCEDADRLFDRLRSGNQRNIRKACREGVQTQRSTDLEAVSAYYRLHCQTRRLHGLPPQPYRFFKLLHRHLISRGQGFVVLASWGEEALAGAVYLTWQRRAVYKFGASERAMQSLRANNVVMWEAIKALCEEGYESLSLGRTHPQNQGLLQFKRQWGGVEQAIEYTCHNLNGEEHIQSAESHKPGDSRSGRIMSRMPLSLLRVLGAVAYRHMG